MLDCCKFWDLLYLYFVLFCSNVVPFPAPLGECTVFQSLWSRSFCMEYIILSLESDDRTVLLIPNLITPGSIFSLSAQGRWIPPSKWFSLRFLLFSWWDFVEFSLTAREDLRTGDGHGHLYIISNCEAHRSDCWVIYKTNLIDWLFEPELETGETKR